MIFTRLSINLTHVSGFFGERCQNETHVYRFFLCKVHQLWAAHPLISYICEVPSPATPCPSCRGTQIILISSIYGMHRFENFATNLWKKCWKVAPFWNGNLNWNTRVKGHPAGAPSVRVPAGLPTLSPYELRHWYNTHPWGYDIVIGYIIGPIFTITHTIHVMGELQVRHSKVSFIHSHRCTHWPRWLRTWGGASSLTKTLISQSAPSTFASAFTLVTLALCVKCRRTLKETLGPHIVRATPTATIAGVLLHWFIIELT